MEVKGLSQGGQGVFASNASVQSLNVSNKAQNSIDLNLKVSQDNKTLKAMKVKKKK
ncbi:hypothetical protein CcarbDRAFT_0710 [Clostridium carboxidivorans P7]|uniref:Uncharacterized protein n=1 Tax=Clostridium carboxidivorans P7 TaxID=536227 RepID=C6PPJ3_9CLOT|nr:hypothetical protein [Clostridium carboxidivorans]EET88887.1 hypothetical protein CcarbDRAFT_0710 [Clostridium carboxidivorans P7]EFG88215.1 hypothetical protein CLCAR_2210 [Clostridium carboxidivorans P7]